MPRLPSDYSRNVNYKLCCLDQSITDIYVGQTTDFTKRKCKHKSSCNNENSKNYNCYVYQIIRIHGGWDNWSMVQIEQYPCKNKREAEARETHLMKELKSTLNSVKSFQTEEEKKYQIKEYLKEYHKTDTYKESQKKYHKEYYKTDKCKEHLKEYQKTDTYKDYLKEYQKTDKFKDYQKEYQKTDKFKQYHKQWKQKKALYLNELKCYNI